MSGNGDPNRIKELNWESWITVTPFHSPTLENGLTVAEVGLAAGECNHKTTLALEWESWVATSVLKERSAHVMGLTQAEVSVPAAPMRTTNAKELVAAEPKPGMWAGARAQAA